jgi:hypothetical protein
MNPDLPFPSLNRREMLRLSGLGFGAVAASWLSATASGNVLRPTGKPRAKSVIMLMQNGGPGQMDLFDPKPDLEKFDGKVHNEQVEKFQKGSEANKLLKSPFKFSPHGQSGMEMSAVIPAIGSIADELCLVRSMVSEHNNHTEGLVLMNTGKIFQGRPALGSWISYGLGSENHNLPAYVVLRDPAGYNTSGTLLWQNGWLPAKHRGTEINTQGSPVWNLNAPKGIPAAARQDDLNFLAQLNRRHQRRHRGYSDLEARIENYELAARMQLEAADLLNLDHESAATKKLYGLDIDSTKNYGLRCLMARRLVEAGVRFVQIFPPLKPQFQPWDAHTDTKKENEQICSQCDLPSAALITDLKQRGLLDDTLVLWTGEFGRLPVSQKKTGRDHNRNAFSLFMAGAGFKRGHIHGATDEVGYRATDGKLTVPDLHATILERLGLDHNALSYLHNGGPETLTDTRVTGARIATELFA